jgi:hypothetical protein
VQPTLVVGFSLWFWSVIHLQITRTCSGSTWLLPLKVEPMCYPVSSRMNSSAYDEPDVIEPF